MTGYLTLGTGEQHIQTQRSTNEINAKKNSVSNIKSFSCPLFMTQEHSIFILKMKNGSKQSVTILGT